MRAQARTRDLCGAVRDHSAKRTHSCGRMRSAPAHAATRPLGSQNKPGLTAFRPFAKKGGVRRRRARRLSVAIGLSYATLGPAEGRRARANRRAGCRELGVLGTMAERNLFLSSSSVAAGLHGALRFIVARSRPERTSLKF